MKETETPNESYMLHLVTREAFFFSALDLFACLTFRTRQREARKEKETTSAFLSIATAFSSGCLSLSLSPSDLKCLRVRLLVRVARRVLY